MFIAHYENTMRNARPKVTPVIAAPRAQAKPVIATVAVPAVKAKPIAAKLPPHVGNSDSATRRRSVRVLSEEAEKAKRTHLGDYRSIVLAMGENPPAIRVIEAVCASHGLAAADVLGNRKFKILTDARRDAIRMVHEVRPDLSLLQLGRIFNRNHATIFYALGHVGTRVAA